MGLRGKKPEEIVKRLKLFMYAGAGTGKTMASIKMPCPYIIDTEKGTENYSDIIVKSKGMVFSSSDMGEVFEEVKSLRTEKHEFKTLVIDSITPLYEELLEEMELLHGTEWGIHHREAGKQMKRLIKNILKLDMNVVITSHEKNEYGDEMKVIGKTFDGWKKLDYIFDLVLNLKKQGKKRFARVAKTRIDEFPDQELFEWSYEELLKRYGPGIDDISTPVDLASNEQVGRICDLLENIKVADSWQKNIFKKAGVEAWSDMEAGQIQACIDQLIKKGNA